MSGHALEVLEFRKVLDRVAGRSGSRLARDRILALEPSADRAAIERELARVESAVRFIEEKPAWAPPSIPEAAEPLRALSVPGAVLEPLQLHAVGSLLASSRLLAGELDAREQRYPELDSVRGALIEDRPFEETLERSVDGEGQVLDGASRELKRIRGRLRGAHARVVRQLEGYLKTLPERHVVSDASVTIRDGRYVIPIRREGRSEVGGIVHDESHTGATLFVEPPVAIELMNQLRDLERQEAREIRRVLGALSERAIPLQPALVAALEALVDFESLGARARSALAWRASVPEMLDAATGAFRIAGARHPLLLESPAEQVVPFDLEILPGERAVVVSGPNTGGKSVLLKTVGLVSALAQSGVIPPVGPGTALPVFSSFFADIGDEQSIAQNLSTFSAHLANLSDIVRQADAGSLVLVDEMGTGTDPAEGAALSCAILGVLVERGAFSVVSSHLGRLKELDGEGSGVVNASLQFDAERLEPTYRLVKGRPGRSYGLAIARRLGFPAEVLDLADRHRAGQEARLEDLLERLERRELETGKLAAELEVRDARTDRLQQELEEREQTLSEAERTAEADARRRARDLLLEARSEVEAAITELRDQVAAGAAFEEAARAARRRVERKAASARRKEDGAGRSPGVSPARWSPGDPVRVEATGARGRVVDVREDRVLVEVGALRLELPAGDLRAAERGGEAPARDGRSGATWTPTPSGGAPLTEVDLRGLRVDEVEVELMRALDRAVLEDLADLRIIHGKGTGALRRRVGELLADDARVKGTRPGGPGEGGAGVTVARLA